eukprot:UN02883
MPLQHHSTSFVINKINGRLLEYVDLNTIGIPQELHDVYYRHLDLVKISIKQKLYHRKRMPRKILIYYSVCIKMQP